MKNNLDKYFNNLSEEKIDLLIKFSQILLKHNKIHNLISRADEVNVFSNHILHSLAIAKFINFKNNSNIFDLGTGGGLPGIPLAIFFNNCQFVLCDSIQKKINVVNEIINELQLKNVKAICARAENVNEKFDFVVTRAVAKMQKLNVWTNEIIKKHQKHNIKNGIIALKGGNLNEELKKFKKKIEVQNISDFFEEEFFETKKIIYLPK